MGAASIPRLRQWLSTGDTTLPRLARSALRNANRLGARVRSGSVAAEMDRIVARATGTEVGSGLSVERDEVSSRRRRAAGSGAR
ncbi:MAG: hypothetical protein R2716_02655 [Microthrixaceae bacterium]